MSEEGLSYFHGPLAKDAAEGTSTPVLSSRLRVVLLCANSLVIYEGFW